MARVSVNWMSTARKGDSSQRVTIIDVTVYGVYRTCVGAFVSGLRDSVDGVLFFANKLLTRAGLFCEAAFCFQLERNLECALRGQRTVCALRV